MPELWPFKPMAGCVETLEFLSEVLLSRTGEQRLALRKAPRQRLTYTSRLSMYDFARAKVYGQRNAGEKVYVPVWGEAQKLKTTLNAGSTFIPFDSTWGDWRVGSQLALWKEDNWWEVATITALAATGASVSAPITRAYTYGDVIPVRLAYVTEGFDIDHQALYADMQVTFQVLENIDRSYVRDYPGWYGTEVMSEHPWITTSIREHIVRAAEYIDSGFGLVQIEDTRNYADQGQTLSFRDVRGPKVWRRKLWLQSLHGKQGKFWVPGFNQDLQLTAPVAANATSMQIKQISPASGYYLNKHFIVEMKNGDKYYRKITGAAGGATIDSISYSPAIGVALNTDNVHYISFLTLSRLLGDEIELVHDLPSHTTTTFQVTEVPDVVFPDTNITPSGRVVTVSVGTAKAGGHKSVDLTGVSATARVGTIQPAGGFVIVNTTSASAIARVGTVSVVAYT